MKVCRKCRQLFEDASTRYCPADGTTLSDVREESAPAPDTLAGQVIDDRFRIISRLGAGGMGTVYLAHQESVDRTVAIKVMSGSVDQASIQRFLREARSTSALRNVHTVVVHDFGQTSSGQLYLAMELLDGTGLDSLLSGRRALPWRRALHIAAQVAESLAEAHDKGLVHRDLKPSNIMLVPMGDDLDFVKVLDFGIAKVVSEGLVTEITQKGSVLGTPTYMSPEQARSNDVDGRSDLYSLGVLLYQLIAGRPPFAGDTPVATLLKHVESDVPHLDVPDAPPQIGEEIRALVLSLLEKDPNRRIQSARLTRRRLLAILETRGPAQPPQAAPPPHAALLPTIIIEGAIATGASPPPSHEGTLTDELSGQFGTARTKRGVIGAVISVIVVGALAAVGLIAGSSGSTNSGGSSPASVGTGSSAPESGAVLPVHGKVDAGTPGDPVEKDAVVPGDPLEDSGVTAAQVEDGTTTSLEALAARGASDRPFNVQADAPSRIWLRSVPSGATVTGLAGDGQAPPKTPILLDAPKKALRLRLSKYDYLSKTIVIEAGRTEDLEIRLKRDPVPHL